MSTITKTLALTISLGFFSGSALAAEIDLKNAATISVQLGFPVHLYPAGTLDFFQALHTDPEFSQNAVAGKYHAIGFSSNDKSYYCHFDRNFRLRETAYSIHGDQLGTPKNLILKNTDGKLKARASCKSN